MQMLSSITASSTSKQTMQSNKEETAADECLRRFDATVLAVVSSNKTKMA